MTCRELTDALHDFVAGELPPERETACHEHLDGCPPCVALLESYQVTIRLARSLPPAAMTPDFAARLQVRLQSHFHRGG